MLVSPSGPTRPERVARGVELLTGWGLRRSPAPNVYARPGYLAGTDALRLSTSTWPWRDPAVRAVVCTRGGYGVPAHRRRRLDLAACAPTRSWWSASPTSPPCSWPCGAAPDWPTVHGPGAAWLRRAHRPGRRRRPAPRADRPPSRCRSGPRRRGDRRRCGCRAAGTGPLLGGNLCLLAASVGTPDLPDLTGAILLLEDVDEPPYKVDRMLLHLRRAGALDGWPGWRSGSSPTAPTTGRPSIVDVLLEHLGALGVPVLGGLPIGHGRTSSPCRSAYRRCSTPTPVHCGRRRPAPATHGGRTRPTARRGSAAARTG